MYYSAANMITESNPKPKRNLGERLDRGFYFTAGLIMLAGGVSLAGLGVYDAITTHGAHLNVDIPGSLSAAGVAVLGGSWVKYSRRA